MFAMVRRICLIIAAVTAASAGASLQPPAGYQQTPQHPNTSRFTCPAFPPPFTGALDFTSKYEGSDSARATLNPQADRAFHEQTKAITELEKVVSQVVTGFAHDGNPARAQCVVNGLDSWARADALTSVAKNHTGKSMRKWALATLSSSWLQLKFSPAHPLVGQQEKAAAVELWLSHLADLTVADWRDLPLKRVNNHSYWAAWAIMATAVVTDRRDLFDQSLAMYRTAANQVDSAGFLPNELRRRQRAFSYHNYAIQPLVMIALFARSNGVEVTAENDKALQRLAGRILSGFDNPDEFTRQTGIPQDVAFTRQASSLAWLEGWCALQTCDAQLTQRLAALRPLHSTRLGGDLSWLFATH
ncbi:Alginate lyase precursor [Phytobacter ursingii]|nr:Alginate lyase precursor [Phytobacter ursingii]